MLAKHLHQILIMKKILITTLLFCSFYIQNLSAQAQTLTYGFKTGLTLSQFDGPSEMNGGQALESNANANGFLVGAIFRYWFTDLVGLKWELLYAQRGSDYTFDGPGFQRFPTQSGTTLDLTGNQQVNLSISNAYVDIPVLLYGKFGRFEIEGGVNIGFLVASSANGQLAFNNGVSANGGSAEDFILTLDYRYRRDDPGAVDFSQGTETITVGGISNDVPAILQTYYLFPEDRGNYFNSIDFGLNAGAYYYWNQGLFIGARFNYGLSDVTTDNYDIEMQALDSNGQFIQRSDKDRNISWQFSLGFSF